ncbi:MAG TPA: hypothetical protein VFS69_02215 [Sphingomicrobium sp.]|nr:hypothetical protein [Sphingomicrobium sp.]
MTTSTTLPASEASSDRWENEGGPARSPEAQAREDLQSELKRYGITPVQLTVFDWCGYRYSNSRDAIAAAKRFAASS